MHELSLAQALVEQVEAIRVREKADAVVSVTVNIGALSGVDRESFEFAFPLAVEGTPLAGTALGVEDTPLTVTCADCGRESKPDVADPHCAACGSARTRVTAGRDFLIQAVELHYSDEPDAASAKGE
jgi:hydrogenase nickel incorporation protein HypA/HybF